jgi:hypothetical protein
MFNKIRVLNNRRTIKDDNYESYLEKYPDIIEHHKLLSKMEARKTAEEVWLELYTAKFNSQLRSNVWGNLRYNQLIHNTQVWLTFFFVTYFKLVVNEMFKIFLP